MDACGVKVCGRLVTGSFGPGQGTVIGFRVGKERGLGWVSGKEKL
jgi:hypothetical protein